MRRNTKVDAGKHSSSQAESVDSPSPKPQTPVKRSPGADRNGRPQPVTSSQVAALAGVSRSAVSRTFTKGASVSPATREAVIEAAHALGYRPNLIARSLITGRSNIIGVVLVHFDNQFYPRLLQELSIRLGREGYRILLFVVDASEEFGPLLEDVLRHRVDALIMASVTLSGHRAALCRAAGVPVLLLNHRSDREDISSVTGDNLNGARTVAAFLVAGGHRSFAIVTGLGETSASRDRESGFTRYLIEHGHGAPTLITGQYSFEIAREAAHKLLSAAVRPDAIFCSNDHMAFAVMGVAREEFGLEIGKDVSIVGFDNAPISSWPQFKLTTFAQDWSAMVDRTVETLMRILASPSIPPEHTVIPGQLIVRGSARLPSTGIVCQDGEQIWLP